MSAHADDLRYLYAEHHGRTVLVAVTAMGGIEPAEPLEPGRYEVSFVTVTDAALAWVSPQGPHGTLAAGMTAAAPATPYDVTEDPKPRFTFIVRPPGAGNATNPPINSLAFRTDAGTVTAVIKKISRGKQ